MIKLRKGIVTIAIVLAACVCGFSNNAYAQEKIGVVDLEYLITQHPDMTAAAETINMETEKSQKEFDEKSAALATIPEKEKLRIQLQRQLDEKKIEVMSKIRDKVMLAVQEIAEAQGFTLVVKKGMPIYGGQDITIEVGKKIRSK